MTNFKTIDSRAWDTNVVGTNIQTKRSVSNLDVLDPNPIRYDRVRRTPEIEMELSYLTRTEVVYNKTISLDFVGTQAMSHYITFFSGALHLHQLQIW